MREMLSVHPEEGGVGLTDEDAQILRNELRQIGPQAFVTKHIDEKDEPEVMARFVGTAFGINPELEVDDETFTRLLTMAIVRAYKKRQKLLQYNTIDDAAELLKRSKNILVITGAGISTSLGIPDFRSKGTGFYDKVRDMGFAEGEEVFDIHYFDEDPTKFYSLAGDIIPDLKRYSPTHAFLKLLQDRGSLQTNFTQNIDNLEALAGIEPAKLIQCHGSFATASCRKCKARVPGTDIFPFVRAKRVAYCKVCVENIAKQRKPKPMKKSKPGRPEWDQSSDEEADNIPQPGVMKPDITFFGEKLDDRFFDRFLHEDSKTADLVVVIGTSLKVAPVSEMPNHMQPEVPHIFISREPIEHIDFDVQLLGDCDHVVFELCRRAGWRLKHEMIPEGFRTKVEKVEGYEHRWKVVPQVPKTAINGGGKLLDEEAKARSRPSSQTRDGAKSRASPKPGHQSVKKAASMAGSRAGSETRESPKPGQHLVEKRAGSTVSRAGSEARESPKPARRPLEKHAGNAISRAHSETREARKPLPIPGPESSPSGSSQLPLHERSAQAQRSKNERKLEIREHAA